MTSVISEAHATTEVVTTEEQKSYGLNHHSICAILLIERSIKREHMADDIDRRTEILDAAFQEFATKGFRGATIKSIAARASLQSPTLIYWYFPTKEALFQAVIEAHSPLIQTALDPTPLLDLPPETVLPLLARGYYATFLDFQVRQLIRLVLAEATSRPEVVNLIGERFAVRILDFIKRYLARQVELGRLRPHDVRASARIVMGMLIPQAIGHILVPSLLADGLSDDEHLTASIEIVLAGLRPPRTDGGNVT
jgi:TetR/AcrR family transcriptional regulator